MLIDSLAPGGAQRQFIRLANGLSEAGHSVTLRWYHDMPAIDEPLLPNVDARLLGGGSSIARKVRALVFMSPLSRATCISFLTTPNRLNCLAFFLSPWTRRIVSERSTDPSAPSAFRRIVRKLYMLADLVVCNSQTQAANLSTCPGLAAKTTYVGNFVDTDRFRPAPADKTAPPFDGAQLRGLVVANFKPAKNAPFLAAALASPSAAGLVIDWYGIRAEASSNHDEYSRTCSILDELGHGRLRLVGRGNQPENIYPRYDFFCLPSLFEGMPNVIAEAMACGLPVICSRVSDNPRLVQEGINGFLFNPRSEDDFAAALARLRDLSPSERRLMGERNRLRAVELFSPDAYIAKWRRLIEQPELRHSIS